MNTSSETMSYKEKSGARTNGTLLNIISNIKDTSPSWGYKRIWSYLRYSCDLDVDKNEVNHLTKNLNKLNRSSSTFLSPLSLNERQNEKKIKYVWQMNALQIHLPHLGWIHMVVVMDAVTGKVLSHYAGLKCQTWYWLVALNKALNHLPEKKASPEEELCLFTDTKIQPTSITFMRACWDLGIQHRIQNELHTKHNDYKTLHNWIVRGNNSLKACVTLVTAVKEIDSKIHTFNKRRTCATDEFLPKMDSASKS